MAKKNKEIVPPKNREYAKKENSIPTLSELNGWYDFAYDAARKKHWEYFVIDQFLKGNHSIKGSPQDNTLILGKKTDSVNFPINKVYMTFRAVRGFVTRHKPTATIEISESSDAAKTYARRAMKVLDRDNLLNNGRRLNKEWVFYGIKYGRGWRQMGYDKDKKVSIRWSVDPWDLFVGTKSGEAEDAPYLVKALTRTVGYWKNKFPKSNVVPDNELAADEYKKLSMQIEFASASSAMQRMNEQTAIGYECWYRVFQPNKNGGLINKCLFTKTEILDVEETPYTEYPFIPYEAEVMPNQPQHDSVLKHVIAPQRMLNMLNTQMLEYNHVTNRGRYVTDKDSGFRVITGKEGQLIIVNPGKRLQVLNPAALSPDLWRQLEYADQSIGDLGGQHDASLGMTPPRVSSGNAIEAIQRGDSNNISDFRDNFEDALSQEAAWILKMYSLFEEEGVVLNDRIKDDKIDTFGIVGQAAYEKTGKKLPKKYYIEDNGSYCDVCSILPENNVKVSIVSQLGETREARMDLLFKLVDAGLPLNVVLEHLEFPNTSDIFERIAQEAVGDAMLENMKAQMGGQGQPQPQPGMQPNGQPSILPMPEDTGDLEALNASLGE